MIKTAIASLVLNTNSALQFYKVLQLNLKMKKKEIRAHIFFPTGN